MSQRSTAPMNTSLNWRKSSYSDATGACVELASLVEGVAVRDSKNPDQPALALTRRQFQNLRNRLT